LAYLAEQAIQQLDGVAHVILAGANAPVSFFAYPGKRSVLVPEGAQVHTLAELDHDVVGALEALADEVAADTEPCWRSHNGTCCRAGRSQRRIGRR
jgi:acetolactate synthase-1/2/3 large subunit